jgi:hypothetical protein
MQLTFRELLTALHGMLFGGLFLMAIFALVVELLRSRHAVQTSRLTPRGESLERWFLILMAATGWLAVFSGTYIVYPWYRAKPPAGTTSLALYPRSLLLRHSNTAAWHNLGMEWKEHIAFFAPIAVTMLAFVLISQRAALRQHPQLRRSVLSFALLALLACGIAATFGALIDKAAPVTGGPTITLIPTSK